MLQGDITGQQVVIAMNGLLRGYFITGGRGGNSDQVQLVVSPSESRVLHLAAWPHYPKMFSCTRGSSAILVLFPHCRLIPSGFWGLVNYSLPLTNSHYL